MTKHTEITAAPTIEYLPLVDLYLSDLNPRHEANEQEIELLAESLVACGLIQNLSGLKDEKGRVGIVAGGRRLRALNIAVKQDPSLGLVPVRIAPDAQTAEAWANVENAVRADLHPADEIRAFGKMYAKNLGAAHIAKVFGTTEARVYRRLALAELPTPILDALKAGDISLSMATAFTVSDDLKRSLELLEQVRGEAVSAQRMKRMLKPDAISDSDRRAVFVGREAYEAEGGKIGGDLFSDEVTFDSPGVLETAFTAKLAEMAEQTRNSEGWKWVDASDASYIGYWDMEQGGYERIYPCRGNLTDVQTERYEELEELTNCDVLDEDGQAELDDLQAVLDGAYSLEQKDHAGAIIYVNQSGELCFEAGLIRKEDKKAAIEAGVLKKSGHQKPDTPKSPYSQKLATDLDAIKLAARQNAILDKPEYLLDLLAFQLCGATGFAKVLDIAQGNPRNTPETETGFVVDERLSKTGATPREMWNVDLSKAFKTFKKKGKKHRNAELTRHLAKVLTGGDEVFGAQIDTESGASIRSVWTPTAENFFKRVSGPYLETLWQSLLELSPIHPTATTFAKLKKGEKAERMENLFSDPVTQKAFYVTAEQKELIEAWVPDYYS